ncbi:metal-dependent hydrolase [Tundrisphaera lichenicola]|uniref:metal-dependent hydrolase n=1 Tax=Tundrisphaera lichenicola TaxID=2029860 RepID=UPI003EBD1B45
MGNYRQHIGFAWFLGVGYSVATYLMLGVHWFYGTVATLLTTLGGLLPDLDSATGVELKGFTGILGVLAAVAVWDSVGRADPRPIFEVHLWAMVLAYIGVRHGLRRVLSRLSKHRGISHSLPTCAVWGLATYLFYPSNYHGLRVLMGVAVMVGFFSHLLLDEICSVDLRGARVNKAFGTAIKLWAPSPWTTVAMYGLLAYLSWLTIQRWPMDPTTFDLPALDIPIQRYASALAEKIRRATHP